MLLTVMGRKTGRRMDVPVNYYQDGDALWVITKRSRNRRQNVKGGVEVDLVLHGKKLKGSAQAILDESAVAAHLAD